MSMYDDDGFNCVDCRINTWVINEYYMIRNNLWSKYGPQDGMLCIGCLEKRMGRKLTPNDFTNAPVNNDLRDVHSPRLGNRLGKRTHTKDEVSVLLWAAFRGYGRVN